MSRRLFGFIVASVALTGSARSLSGQDNAAKSRERAVLAVLVDSLEAAGEWRSAIAPLDRLLALGPADPARLRQRGLFAAWSGDRSRGVELLRRAVAERPRSPEYLGALAEVLSWSTDTRQEAARTYVQALGVEPGSAELLLGYADLLSWTPDTRDSARALYTRVLSRQRDEPRARVGLANLLAWQGQPAKALKSYDSVLAALPDYPAALRGRGGALNQLGRHGDAARSLERALVLAPGDRSASGELARAELGRGHFRSARAHLDAKVEPMLRGVSDSALRATASSAEVSGLARRRQNQLDVNRLAARATGSIGSFKLYGEYQHSALEDAALGFRSEGYGGGMRVDQSALTVQASGRLRSIRGVDSKQWDGSFDLGWRMLRGLSLGLGASRSPVEENRRTVQGELDGGARRGVVHANLGYATLVLDGLPGPLDGEATVQAGRYTGMGLEANQRVGLDTRIGLVLNGTQPWVRIGYGFAASRFDYNAGLAIAQAPAQRGGYFSPAEYWRHQGIVQVSQRFGLRVRWDADARMGREWVRPLDGAATSQRNTAVVNTTLTIRAASGLDLEGRFLYVNAFDAFKMKELSTVVKVYFP